MNEDGSHDDRRSGSQEPQGVVALPVVDVRDLTRRFGEITAVSNVSFQVARGAIFGLLGPNGSGKSTIIRMLLGVLPPTAGSAKVLGADAIVESERVMPRVGYMSQRFSLYADLTVRENLDFYGRIYGLDATHLNQRREEVLKLTWLGAHVDQLAGTLSGGWQRRLALACALIHDPELVFLDEPTAKSCCFARCVWIITRPVGNPRQRVFSYPTSAGHLVFHAGRSRDAGHHLRLCD